MEQKQVEIPKPRETWWIPWYCEGNPEELPSYYVPKTIFALSKHRKVKESLMNLQKFILHKVELARIYDFRLNMSTEEEMEAAEWAKYNAPQLLGTVQSESDNRVYCFLRFRGAQKLCIPL